MNMHSRMLRKKMITVFSLLAPAFLLYFVIVLLPVIQTFFLSFHKWSGIGPKEFVGFRNYITAFNDSGLFNALRNNIIWMLSFITIPIILALGIGLSLTHKRIKGRDAFQAIFFIPNILSSVVVATIWKVLYSPNVGILSWLLMALHVVDEPYGLLGDSSNALFGLIAANIWTQFGYCAVIYITGLQNVDPDLYDAADIDGAGSWRKLKHITLPSISSVTTMLVLVNITNSFKAFDYVFLMTKGGPIRHTELVTYMIYKEAFKFNKFGYASALAILLAIIVCAICMVYFNTQNRKNIL